MSNSEIASCNKDLLFLNYFNLEIPNHLLAKKHCLDRHTIQKYVKENLFNERTVLQNSEFAYLENKYTNILGIPNKCMNCGNSDYFYEIRKVKEKNTVTLPFLDLSSVEEITDLVMKIDPYLELQNIDLFEGISEINTHRTCTNRINEININDFELEIVHRKKIKDFDDSCEKVNELCSSVFQENEKKITRVNRNKISNIQNSAFIYSQRKLDVNKHMLFR